MKDWSELAARLNQATGADPGLDQAIADAFNVVASPYTASVEDCHALVATALAPWRLHLGFDASGIFPYAALSRQEHRHWVTAPTLPLAILRAAVVAAGDDAVDEKGRRELP